MHINFSIDTTNPEDVKDFIRLARGFEPSFISGTFQTPIGAIAGGNPPNKPTQPQVVENSGSTGTGLILSPGAGAGDAAGAEAASTAVDAPAATRPRGRKPKDAVVPAGESAPAAAGPDTSALAPAAAPATEPAGALTLDDVRAKLQAFTVAKGVPEGIALLKKFEAARISELPAEKYADFMAACEVTA